MIKKQGNALSQYVIIIALVAIFLVPIFFVFGQTIVKELDNFYLSLSGKSSLTTSTQGNTNTNGNTKLVPGSLNGTVSNPVAQCNSGTCTVDFGSYILSGIPENTNIGEETAGGYGTDQTDLYASMFDQLAQQLEATSPVESKLLKSLADVAKTISAKEKLIGQVSNKSYTKIVGININGKLSGNVFTDLATFGVKGDNLFKNYWPKTTNSSTLSMPLYNQGKAMPYNPSFDAMVLNGSMPAEAYIKANPTQDAALLFGLWNKINSSDKIPQEIKNVVSLNTSEIANIASGINLDYDKDNYIVYSKEKIKANMPKEAFTISNYKASLICSAQGKC